ncbi:MAG: bifunctional (p)ppGpp synthetase/guanosine-3',5'-bis(diphosphate) 3'-pyrophosphohydrolase [Gammaproteobacteria bacterium]|nr:bifunctional (p)ppGpp synthetase/guanosine-3',5'-bis(diphosphate) 3'-pyrophosphohydrolase [Gammaproteobacteria bacterium]
MKRNIKSFESVQQTFDTQQQQCIDALNSAFTQVEATNVLEPAFALLAEYALGAEAYIVTALWLSRDLAVELGGDVQKSCGSQGLELSAELEQLQQKSQLWMPTPADAETDVAQKPMMFLSLVKDLRVVFVVLAKHLAVLNMNKQQTETVQQELAWQSFNFFAPIANRLGLGQLKWEIEDLALRFSHPAEYKKIAKALEEKRIDRETYVLAFAAQLKEKLALDHIQGDIYARPKHIYSIWKKMQKKELSFEQLYDIRAVRVLVENINDCYAVLGLVHSLWNYIASEYDDYIAAPKSNGYQSLHTAVLGPENKTVEVQIRTFEMHDNAENGIAAHWRYKEGSHADEHLDNTLDLYRNQLENIQDEATSSQKITLTETASIYVLTPQGRVISLPRGATALDFAYHVHTNVGHRCRGAKVDGHMVNLKTALESGQQVEIITQKNATPSRDWLYPQSGYLKTSRARSKVRQWFKQQFRQEHINSGKSAIQSMQQHLHLDRIELAPLVKRYNFFSEDDLYAAIGRGEIGIHQVENQLLDKSKPTDDESILVAKVKTGATKAKQSQFAVNGVDDLMSHLARCCKPLPGDEVKGFITRGRGIAVHRLDCQNLMNLKRRFPQRIVDVDWGGGTNSRFEIDVEIHALDRSGLLRDVTSVVAAEDVNVLAANTQTNKRTREAKMVITLELSDHDQLTRAMSRLEQIQSVLSVHRKT